LERVQENLANFPLKPPLGGVIIWLIFTES
jgi:hypothetical protein